MAGYSGTPLWKKLGLKDGLAACVVNPPDDYHSSLLDGAPAAVWQPLVQDASFVHVFTKSRAEMEALLNQTRTTQHKDGMVWISWPKKASKVPTDITEGTIREVALPIGYVDVKVCAVTEVWSGLKLVIRKELR